MLLIDKIRTAHFFQSALLFSSFIVLFVSLFRHAFFE